MAAPSLEKLDQTHETADMHPQEALRTYYIIFAWLMVLLIVTVAASLVPFDRFFPGLNVIVALTIAVIKAALVVMFFMHVKHASKLTWIFASAAFLWLGIMLALTFNDYTTRDSLQGASSAQPPAPGVRATAEAAPAIPRPE